MPLHNALVVGGIVVAIGLMLAMQPYLSKYRQKERRVNRKLEDEERIYFGDRPVIRRAGL